MSDEQGSGGAASAARRLPADADDLEDLEDLFENAPCGYVSATPDGRIVRCNRTLLEWTGHARTAVVGRRFPELLNIAGKIYYETHFAPLLRMQGHFDEVALDLVRADRSTFPVLVNAIERRDADGGVRFVRITIFNAIDRRRYETELLATRARAEASAAQLQELAESLEKRVEEGVARRLELEEVLRQAQKMEAVGQLTGGLAHDFNNLLTGISGNLELLQLRTSQGRPSADLTRYIVAAHGATKRAAALTHRLLAFARRQTLDPRPTDVNRLVAEMEELLRRTLEPQAELSIDGAPDLWTALVDANQLENALLNLCINARDAMPDGGRIAIRTENRWLDGGASREHALAPGPYLSICVTDTGMGMTPEVIARAFDPFFTTKPLGAGTGLGLSMVYGFARQSGGQVRIVSEPGCGTEICIDLPRHLGDADLPDAGVHAPAGHAAGRDEAVLVVDDEPTVRSLIVEVLTERGYRTIEAPDGSAGLRLLQGERRIDLLLTDVGLPGGIDGRQVADAGRALRPALRVLFITGYADHAVFGARLQPGTEVLTKPFAVDDLVRRVEALMGTA